MRHHDRLGYISGMQVWFNILKTIDVIDQKNKINDQST